MEIIPSHGTVVGPPEMFDGAVFLDMLFSGREPSLIRVSLTRFAPGSRTLWHRHRRGQLLHVTEGRGLVQSRDQEVVDVSAGETIYTPPDEWHWHGATTDQFMTHLAIWQGLDPADDRADTDWETRAT